MATRAARTRTLKERVKSREQGPGENASPSTQGPQRWWQWFFIYPALGASLLTAAPQWVDKTRTLVEGVNTATIQDAEKQNLLWKKNLSCSAAPFAWYSNPNNVKIDATICDSGDIFVRAITPTNDQFFKWLPIDDVVQQTKPKDRGLVPSANAATLDSVLAGSGSRAKALFHYAQMANILCQKFIDDRRILRRVQTPQGCFDEVIDTYNGAVIQRNPAPCTPQC